MDNFRTAIGIIEKYSYQLYGFSGQQFRKMGLSHLFYDLSIVYLFNIITDKSAKISPAEFFLEYEKLIKGKSFEGSPHYGIFINTLNILTSLTRELESAYNTSELKLLSDRHGKTQYKINIGDEVISKSDLSVEKFITVFLDTYPMYSKYFYEYKISSNLVIRKFIKSTNSITDLKQYYFNLGEILAIVYFIKAVDIISENLLNDINEIPRLFDLDFVIYPDINNERKYTIESSGMLISGSKFNNSSTFSGAFDKTSILRPFLTSEAGFIKIKWINIVDKPDLAYPNQMKDEHPIKYLDNFTAGFTSAYKLLESNRSCFAKKIASLDFNTRYLVRSTSQYRYVVMKSLYSQFDNSNSLSTEFKKILKELIITNKDSIFMGKLIEYESKFLQDFSYPFYYVNSLRSEIYSSESQIVGNLSSTPMELYLKHLDSFPNNFQNSIETIKSIYQMNHIEWLKSKNIT